MIQDRGIVRYIREGNLVVVNECENISSDSSTHDRENPHMPLRKGYFASRILRMSPHSTVFLLVDQQPNQFVIGA